MSVSSSVSELHALVRAQVRGDSARVGSKSAAVLSSSERAAAAAFRRRLRRSRGQSVVTPSGREVWGVA